MPKDINTRTDIIRLIKVYSAHARRLTDRQVDPYGLQVEVLGDLEPVVQPIIQGSGIEKVVLIGQMKLIPAFERDT